MEPTETLQTLGQRQVDVCQTEAWAGAGRKTARIQQHAVGSSPVPPMAPHDSGPFR